ncbi:hypothetical protein CP973_17125 [Streptomyces albofaciens JCM 4342]|nr:hypothetical protein CP973_17125 [Streptomyces albofaciens JCM 4342]
MLFPRPRPPLPGPVRVWLPALAGATAAAWDGGCAGPGEARSAGPAPATSAPSRLRQEPTRAPSPGDTAFRFMEYDRRSPAASPSASPEAGR